MVWKRIFAGRAGSEHSVQESPSDVLARGRRNPRRLLLGVAAGVVALVGAGMIASGLSSAPEPAPMPPRSFTLKPSAVPDPVTEPVPHIGVPHATVTRNPQVTPTPSTGGVPATSTPAANRPQVPDGPIESRSLYIPALGVRARVVSTGIVDGLLRIPSDVSEVTMWDGSAGLAARTGTVLVAGHVDNVHQGKGALWPLHLARPGDAVYLTGQAEVTRWKVVGVESVVKSALPPDVWAGVTGRRVLKLVTCGGVVVHGNYLNNVIVTAVPF